MTETSRIRPISTEESDLLRRLIIEADVERWDPLLLDIDGASVRPESRWVLDIVVHAASPGVDMPNGPLPIRAYVPSKATYEGEIIIWIRDGHLSGLEYAWVTETPPTQWPNTFEVVTGP